MSDGRVWVWSTLDGKVHQVLTLTDRLTHDVEFSPSGRWLAASSDSGIVRLWEYNPASDKYEFNGLEFANGEKATRVTSIQFSPYGRLLICGGTKLVLFDLQHRKLIGEIEGAPKHEPMYLSLSPDGRTLLTTSIRLEDPLVRVWDLQERKFKRVLLDQTSLNELFTAWAPDGSVVIGGALANVVDRAGDGRVTDYLHTGWWPTFNLADTFLVTGFIVIALLHARPERTTSTTPEAVEDHTGNPAVADHPPQT